MLVRWFFIFLCPFTHALAQELSGIQEYRKSSEDSSIVQGILTYPIGLMLLGWD